MADPSGKSPSGAQEAPRRYYALFPPQGELLELYRRGEATWKQSRPLGPIEIVRKAS